MGRSQALPVSVAVPMGQFCNSQAVNFGGAPVKQGLNRESEIASIALIRTF
jgi:hypothetical protein